jgi:hypothetical protein
MERTHLSPLPPDVALLLSPASVRALLAGRAGASLAPFDADDPIAVAEALAYRPVPSSLAGILALLARLATPVGREALLEALAQDQDASAIAALERFAPADLAARVLVHRGLSPRQARAAIRRALASPLLYPDAILREAPDGTHGRDDRDSQEHSRRGARDARRPVVANRRATRGNGLAARRDQPPHRRVGDPHLDRDRRSSISPGPCAT